MCAYQLFPNDLLGVAFRIFPISSPLSIINLEGALQKHSSQMERGESGRMQSKDFDKELYRDEWRWKEGEYTVTRSTQWSAPGCHMGCGVLLYTDKDGKLVKVEGDPNNNVNDGRLCMRCFALPELTYHKDRIVHPMKRDPKDRGKDKWVQITWDEALDLMEEKARAAQEAYGGKSIITLMGTGRNAVWHPQVAAYDVFDSPNISQAFLSGDSCYGPRIMASTAIIGAPSVADMSQFLRERYDDPRYRRPDTIIIWGTDPTVSNSDGFFGPWVVDCMKLGSKVIVVDPRINWYSAKATVALQVRPGTDGALAMAIANVMIAEDLYDHDFVERWVYGFEEFKARVAEYPPEKAERITWVPKEDIIKAARIWATNGTSSLHWGLPLDQYPAGVGAAHAVMAAQILTGDIDKPGTTIIAGAGSGEDTGMDIMAWFVQLCDQDLYKDRIGFDKYIIRQAGNGDAAQPDELLKQIESSEPYPIMMCWGIACNPIACMGADQERVYHALMKIPFNVFSDVFMTPTIMGCADLILPAAFGTERNGIRGWWTPIRAINKATQTGEAMSDDEIVMAIGKRLHPERFPWDNDVELQDTVVHEMITANLDHRYTFHELREKGNVYPDFEYERYEKGLLRDDGNPGFATSTGRAELWCTLYSYLGVDPLPYFEEPPESPYSTPELFKKYPFVLTTGRRIQGLFHSEHRNSERLREFHPWPLCEINDEDAAAYGIENNDWVYLENPHGKAKYRALINPGMMKGVINAEHAWWFPERNGEAPELFGVFESNANNLTTQDQCGPSSYGSPYKTQICKLYKAEC